MVAIVDDRVGQSDLLCSHENWVEPFNVWILVAGGVIPAIPGHYHVMPEDGD